MQGRTWNIAYMVTSSGKGHTNSGKRSKNSHQIGTYRPILRKLPDESKLDRLGVLEDLKEEE